MFKIKNNLLFLNVFLFIGLVLLFVINNNQVIAMNNGQNHEQLEQHQILQNMISKEARIVQQIVNARNNNFPEKMINLLRQQHKRINQQIYNQQIFIFLENQKLALIEEMDIALNNTPLYSSKRHINIIRNIQIRINQNQTQINTIIQQRQNNL
ncbi:SVM family protein [Candidatus Phytoplasma rubi]|uniref:SVM family protein n=1 Tax=Candidatus Phytoplasma rubi TaxID=399025 RepID=A0ABY7BTK0_9MOLU|nr:SVM family protein [Candidatus Phytoplasma rubi]WAN63305.1 SVM family protein [Candidatus Phytoplasma rubi]